MKKVGKVTSSPENIKITGLESLKSLADPKKSQELYIPFVTTVEDIKLFKGRRLSCLPVSGYALAMCYAVRLNKIKPSQSKSS